MIATETIITVFRMDHTGRGIDFHGQPVRSTEDAVRIINERKAQDDPNSLLNPRPVYWYSERDPQNKTMLRPVTHVF